MTPYKYVTAISRVLGDGRKVETVVLQYDTPISNRSLSAETYRVAGKEVTRIYANNAPERARQGADGPYVIIEVKAEVDLNAQPPMPTDADKEKKARLIYIKLHPKRYNLLRLVVFIFEMM